MGFRKISVLVTLAVAVAPIIGAAAAAQQPAPRFRGGVDIVQLDVAVLDRSRRPVPDLTADDFTVLEDGKPQPIIAFEELSAPDPDGSLVPWMRDVAPDVRTNSADGRRIFVLVLDDVSIAGGPYEVRIVDTVKKIARTFVERMGPLDQACVVFTGDNRVAQDFTSDRRALLATIERFHGTAVPPFLRGLYPASVVGRAAQSLIEVSHRRKAMIYIGSGIHIAADLSFAQMGVPIGEGASQSHQNAEAEGAIRHAQRANVSIYTINPRGLETFWDEASRTEAIALDDGLHTIANQTGGFAVSNTNSFDGQVSQIFTETGSYYLLGFRSAYSDGKFRRITVKVNRPGMSVRTRSGYYAPKPENPAKPASPLFKAMAGVLPNPDMYMRAAVAPFAAAERPSDREKKMGGVAIALGLSQPSTPGERASHVLDLVVSAFTREGKAVAQRRQTARLTMRPTGGEAKYEIVSRLDLKPGRYNLRFAVHNRELGRSGSVYAEVDVPNFEKDRLSLSGAVLGLAQRLPAAATDTLAGLIPFAPTTQRSFASGDQVTVFLRAYQGGKKPPLPVALRASVTDARDRVVFDSRQSLAPAREADFSMPLPAGKLAPGPYLLTIEASVDEKTIVRRDVRFAMR